jgi:hypothetical protein
MRLMRRQEVRQEVVPGKRPLQTWHEVVAMAATRTTIQPLLGNESVNLNPPYNVPMDGHACGSGRIRHREFFMGVGEMDKAYFTRFLVDTLTPVLAARTELAFVCMGRRHMSELLARFSRS